MGNCYEDSRTIESKGNQIILDESHTAISSVPVVIDELRNLPVISPHIQNRMQELGPFNMSIPKTVYQLKNKSVYQGGFKNKLFDGPAKLILADGTVIQSQFQLGVPSSKTRIFKANGDYFSGFIQRFNGKQTGTVFEKGILYEGELKNKKPHGKGIEKTKSYNYTGVYENGLKIHGKLEWNLQNPKFIQSYEGDFRNNMFHGFGTLINNEGKYIGNFDQGIKNGYGELTYPNGKVYKGNFVKNKPDGQGKLYDVFGNMVEEGKWINGKKLLSQQAL